MPDKKNDPIDAADTDLDTTFIDVEPIEDQPAQDTTLDTTPPKKRNIWVIVIISLLAAAILAVGTTLAFTTFFNDDAAAPTTNTETVNESETKDTLSAKELVASAVAATTGVKNAPTDNKGSAAYPVFAAPVFKPSGYEFSVRPFEDYGLFSTGTKETALADLNAVKSILLNNKLAESIKQAGDDQAMFIAYYESSTIICGLSDQKPYQVSTGATDYTVTLGCADKSAYTDNAKTLKPYFDVYKNQSEYDTSKLTLSMPVVKESPIKGYSNAGVSINGSEYDSVGGFAALFYTTPDGALRFFKGTQNSIPCEDFNTDDIRKAYAGESCYDETDDAAVVKVN